MSALERFQLDTYALGLKYGVFSKKNEEIPEEFVEEENELTAAVQEQLEQMEAQEAEEERLPCDMTEGSDTPTAEPETQKNA